MELYTVVPLASKVPPSVYTVVPTASDVPPNVVPLASKVSTT